VKPTLPLSPSFIDIQTPKFLPFIERFQREQSLHPTILVTGLEGVGKKSAVLQFVQFLFCDQSIFAKAGNAAPESETENLFGFAEPSTETKTASGRSTGLANGKPCGECKSCKRALQNQWLDLYWLEPETNEEETRIGTHKIDAFREVKSKLGMGPTEEPFKVVVITEADRMTPQAANSILKTLEEPPKNWVFILTAADSSRLLPTILSRCIELKMSPLTPAQIFTILKETKGLDLHTQRGQTASRAALGSLSRAQYFLEEETWEIRDAILGLLSHPSSEWLKLIDLLSQTQRDFVLGLDILESIFTDLLNTKIYGTGTHFIHDDQKEFLLQWMDAKNLSAEKIIHVLTSIAEKRRFSRLTLNGKLLAQETLIPLLELIIS
jgi:DNA polymerase-3 subunit delta'